MRVMGWQCESDVTGAACGNTRQRPVTDGTPMTIAAHAAGRSFGLHNYIKRPWGLGDAAPG